MQSQNRKYSAGITADSDFRLMLTAKAYKEETSRIVPLRMGWRTVKNKPLK